MSTMDDDMSHDDADYGDGGEDGKPGLAAFLGGHVGLPVGQGFGFGGDSAGSDGRDVRAHLIFERGILARVVEGLLVFVVVVVHGPAPFLLICFLA